MQNIVTFKLSGWLARRERVTAWGAIQTIQ